MFKKISYKIALQFMAFVFLLLLINGLVFLAADFGNEQRQSQFRLQRFSHSILEHAPAAIKDLPGSLPPPLRERVRIVDAAGKPLYSGGLFSELPFSHEREFSEADIQNDRYGILTTPILSGAQVAGYLQVTDVERFQFGDLPVRALLYLLGSIGISVLTFYIGLLFARRSLKPAEQMMGRLEQFTQDASHELRTPLAALSSSLDLALKNGKHKEGIISAKEDLKEVAVLVERLLEIARLDTFLFDRETIDFSALAISVVAKHRPLAAGRHVTIETSIQPDITASGDAALLKQVVTNLLSNAIKFSKPVGGQVNVRLTTEALVIEDRGIGIASAALPHIFDRFFQADTSRADEGFGLGLALVKRIVELHGWRIDATSKEGEGTAFTVVFSSR